MKMYILILNDVPDEFAPVIAAHASLACYLKFEKDPSMILWVNGIFKKVVCSVNQSEFEKAKDSGIKFIEITESSLDGRVVALAFLPVVEYSKCFKYFKLWKPKIL